MPSPPATTTVPVMSGWMTQKYGNVPAVVKVRLYVPPWSKIPLSHDESVAVTVCWSLSLFAQVTVAPSATVIDDGEKLRSTIVTSPEAGGGGGGSPGSGGGASAVTMIVP